MKDERKTMNLPSKNGPVNHLWWLRPYLPVLEPLLHLVNSVKRLRLPHSPLSVGQDQQDWLGGWKLTDPLERRTQRIEWWMIRKGWTSLGWPRALLLFPSSWTLFMEGTERIDYTEQSSPNSPGWKGRMWTDGTKEELSLLSAGYIGPLDHEEGVPYTGPESPSRLGTTKVIINGWLSSSSCFLVTTEAEPKRAGPTP